MTLESEPRHAEIAAENIERAGLSEVVDLRVGPAQETLPKLVDEGLGPFDLIFIDADKKSYPEYFGWALELSRPGTLIVADNVIRNGGVADLENTDVNVVEAAPDDNFRRSTSINVVRYGIATQSTAQK